MPKTPIDYNKTHFYKIVCKDTDNSNMYIGHTTNFVKRKNTHKRNTINPNSKNYNCNLYKFIRSNGYWDNWSMILLDTCECQDRLDALKKERAYIEMLKPSLNQFSPYRTDDDKEQQRTLQNEKKRQDRKDSPEKYKEIDKNKYEKRREQALDRAKEYYKEKKDEINDKKKMLTITEGERKKQCKM